MAGGLDAEQKSRRHEDGFERELHALIDGIALLLRCLDEADEAVEFVIGYGPTIGPAREIGEIGASAGQCVMAGCVAAAKNAGVAFRKRRSGGIVGSADFDVAKRVDVGKQFDHEPGIASAEVQAKLQGAGFGGDTID